MDELRAIRVFTSAAEHGSFARAAAELGLSPQAVSKTIGQLEAHLQLRLFRRTTRQSALTEEGLHFLEAVRPGLDALSLAVSRVRSAREDMSGVLRIAAAHSARKVLGAPLAEFAAAHPEVRVELILADHFSDVVAERIDVGFRSGLQPRGHLIARQLFAVQQILCAAPAYLAAHGTPRSLAELALHRCTGFRLSESGRLLPWELMVDGELRRVEVPAHFCTNDPEAEVDAVAAGLGIGLLDSINAAAPIRAGLLQPLLPEHLSDHMGFHLYYSQRSNMPQRVRVFIDFIVARLHGSEEFRVSPGLLRQAKRRTRNTPG